SEGDSVGFVPAGTADFVDRSVLNGDTYYYRLVSVDEEGRFSRVTRDMVARPRPIGDDYVTAVAYYPWYTSADAWHQEAASRFTLREVLDPPQEPALGFYDSRDSAVIDQHIAWSEENGIDVWAISWWGPLQSGNNETIRDYIAPRLLGRSVRYCAFMEFLIHPEGDNAPTGIGDREIDLFIQYFSQLAEDHFVHPNYYTFEGRPVVFLYSTFNYFGDLQAAFGQIRQAMRDRGYEVYLIGDEMGYELGDPAPEDHMFFLDATTWYVRVATEHQQGFAGNSGFLLDMASLFNQERLMAAAQGLAVVPNVSPGFNSRALSPEHDLLANPLPVLPRQVEPGAPNTSTLEEEIRIMRTFVDPDLNLIWITSWNEWLEDSQIEPTTIAPATASDVSQTRSLYTAGYAYEGYGTSNLDVVRTLLSPGVSYVGISPDGSPDGFELAPAFPNPFSGATVISYRLSGSAPVRLSVYDVLGRRIHDLVDDVRSEGRHEVTWRPEGLASGLYFLRLEAQGATATQTCLFLASDGR
ncbi:MAG: T9SS type A sorting domain-containing protein, partial [Rhodothermales bacterium]